LTAVSTHKFSLVFRKLDATRPFGARSRLHDIIYWILNGRGKKFIRYSHRVQARSFTSGERDRRRTEPRPREYSLHTISVFNLLWREAGRRTVPFYVCKNHKSLIKGKKTLYYELTEYLIKVSQTVKNRVYFFRPFVYAPCYIAY